MDSFNNNVIKRIYELTESREYTFEELAELTDMGEKRFDEIINGKECLTIYELFVMSRCLGVTMDYLATGGENDETIKLILSIASRLDEHQLDDVEKLIQSLRSKNGQ